MIKKIFFSLFIISSFATISGCGSVNFPPGKAYIGADGGDGF